MLQGAPACRSSASGPPIGYRHRQYEAATDRYSPYRKMLAALWRESPVPSLRDGERLATMASLLHVDRDGASLRGAR